MLTLFNTVSDQSRFRLGRMPEYSLTLHIPPRLSSPPASNIVTSKPWPTQCAADVTPVIPAPMIATLGLRRGLLLSGGAGDRILSVKYWKSWNQNRNGCSKGFSTLDSEGIFRSSGVFKFRAQVGKNVDKVNKRAIMVGFVPTRALYRRTSFGAPAHAIS